MRPSSSDEDHSELSEAAAATATSVAAAASAAAAVFAANTAAGVNPPDVRALSMGIWRPWGVGLNLRLSDVFEVNLSAFLTLVSFLGKSIKNYLILRYFTKHSPKALAVFCGWLRSMIDFRYGMSFVLSEVASICEVQCQANTELFVQEHIVFY